MSEEGGPRPPCVGDPEAGRMVISTVGRAVECPSQRQRLQSNSTSLEFAHSYHLVAL